MEFKYTLRRETDAARVFAFDQEQERRRRDNEATRILQPLLDAARELKKEFAGDSAVRIQIAERHVAMRFADDRGLKISLNRYLDDIGFRYQGFHIEDKKIVHSPDYEEIETVRDVDGAHQAIRYAITVCAEYRASQD